VRNLRARTLAAAGVAVAGAAIGAAAYLLVGGLPGLLYAGGICLAALFGAAAVLGRTRQAREPESTARQPRWRRKSHVIAELETDLAATNGELENHRQALANLGAQLANESETARLNAEVLEQRIRKVEAERDALQELVAQERERFEETLDTLGGGIGGHANELARLERELEALIAR
jgi:chromosome segregation ATPase